MEAVEDIDRWQWGLMATAALDGGQKTTSWRNDRAAQQEDKRAVQGEAMQQPTKLPLHCHYDMWCCHLSCRHGVTWHHCLTCRHSNRRHIDGVIFGLTTIGVRGVVVCCTLAIGLIVFCCAITEVRSVFLCHATTALHDVIVCHAAMLIRSVIFSRATLMIGIVIFRCAILAMPGIGICGTTAAMHSEYNNQPKEGRAEKMPATEASNWQQPASTKKR